MNPRYYVKLEEDSSTKINLKLDCKQCESVIATYMKKIVQGYKQWFFIPQKSTSKLEIKDIL